MKHLIVTVILSILSFSLCAQCDIANPGFESWGEQTVSLDDSNPDLEFQVELPDDHVSILRFLLYTFGVFFGEPNAVGDYMSDPQAAVGIAKSSDANSGNFAVKLQATSYVNFADSYTVWNCSEVPDSIDLFVKHVGSNIDTLTILTVFDQGLSPLPEDFEDLSDIPAYASNQIFFNSDTDYENLRLPVIKNFEAPIDTAYMLFVLSSDQSGLDAGMESYVLIDDINTSGMPLSTHQLANSTINIFPNPTTELINIDIAGDLNFQASLYDLDGRLIITANNSNLINIQSVPNGFYLLEIIDLETRQKVIEKIIVE